MTAEITVLTTEIQITTKTVHNLELTAPSKAKLLLFAVFSSLYFAYLSRFEPSDKRSIVLYRGLFALSRMYKLLRSQTLYFKRRIYQGRLCCDRHLQPIVGSSWQSSFIAFLPALKSLKQSFPVGIC